MLIQNQQTASDVFAFRKEIKADLADVLDSKSVSQEQIGHIRKNLSKALNISRKLMQQDRHNKWHLLAFGWTVIDCIKLAMKNNHKDKAKRLFQELDRYPIPASEVSLTKVLTKYRHILMENRPDPAASSELAEAADLCSRGEHLEACHVYQKVIRNFSHDERVNISYGWAISKALKVLSDEKKPPLAPFMNLLRCYAKLNIFDAMKRACRLRQLHEADGVSGRSDERDSLTILHTTILNYAVKVAKKQTFPDFISFVRWWNLENLCNSDYEKFTPEGSDKVYNSLVEKLIKALYQTAKTIENVDEITFALDFIESSINRFPDNVWLIYYCARLNVKLGRHEEAQKRMIPVVLRKMNDPWAWERLGETLDDDDMDHRLACLCRALCCPNVIPEYAVNIHEKLGRLLQQHGMSAEAKHGFNTAMAIRETAGDNVDAVKDNKNFYQQHAPMAEALVYADLPERVGIVEHVNTHKELTFVVFDETDTACRLYHDRFPMAKSLSPGDFVAIKYRVKPAKQVGNKAKTGRSPSMGRRAPVAGRRNLPPSFNEMGAGEDVKEGKMQPVDVRVTTTPPTGSFYETYHGPINICQGGRFGFVEDVYIPGHLISAEIEFADEVTGITIHKWNRKKGRPAWSALTLKKASNG